MLILPVLIALAGGVALYIVSNKSSELSMISVDITNDNYLTYDEYRSNLTVHNSKRVVYFFHASWCPTCRALENDIRNNIGSIPSDVIIVKTDFDTQLELRKKYGVTVQHTLVQIKDGGEMVGKWIAQPSLSSVLEDLQSI